MTSIFYFSFMRYRPESCLSLARNHIKPRAVMWEKGGVADAAGRPREGGSKGMLYPELEEVGSLDRRHA